MKKKLIEAVMVFVFDEENNLLLLKRNDNNKWEPVKGGIKEGECWLSASEREVNEETGLTITFGPVLVSVVNDTLDTSQGKATKIKGYVSYCYVDGKKPKPKLEEGEPPEHKDYKWVKENIVLKKNIYPPIANKLIRVVLSAKNKT